MRTWALPSQGASIGFAQSRRQCADLVVAAAVQHRPPCRDAGGHRQQHQVGLGPFGELDLGGATCRLCASCSSVPQLTADGWMPRPIRTGRQFPLQHGWREWRESSALQKGRRFGKMRGHG